MNKVDPLKQPRRPVPEREALQPLLEGFVHELRTPLTAIRALTDILLQLREQDAGKRREFLTTLRSESLRLQGLMEDLFRQVQATQDGARLALARIRVEDLVERAACAAENLFRQGDMELYRSLEEGLPAFTADEGKLVQVLVNLLSNAVKFSPSGARVLVEADVLPTDPFGTRGPFMHVTVRDQGCGIPEHALPLIFNRHYTAWHGDSGEPPPGSGLGLAICRDIVALHHGRIWAESIYGSGSAFHFTVPLHPTVPHPVRARRAYRPPDHEQPAAC